MNVLNENLKYKIKEKYKQKLKNNILKKYSINSYTLEVLESNIIFFKNNYESTIDKYNKELRDFLEKVLKKKIHNFMDYKVYRNNIFRIDLIHKLLDNLNLENLEEFYLYVKDKRIFI